MSDASSLKGRVALITGGGTGLGLEIARTYARRGALVALASRSPEHLSAGRASLEAEGLKAATETCDVRDVHAVRRLVKTVESELGGIDILVNNAAGNFVRPAEDLPEKAFANVVDIVLNGTFYATRAVGRSMIARGSGGVILNVVATYAWTGGPGTIHSACAKAGVSGDDAHARGRVGGAPHSRGGRRPRAVRLERRGRQALAFRRAG
jgi:NAD(P)-dependent dehydrogenase (short-subunit alcohol dehydrogenase family)